MKKTLFLLASFAVATPVMATTLLAVEEPEMIDYTFNGATTLASKREQIMWETGVGATLDSYVITFSITQLNGGYIFNTNASGDNGDVQNGLGLDQIGRSDDNKSSSLSIVNFTARDTRTQIGNETVAFGLNDTLALAYDSLAKTVYLGNVSTHEYITYTLTGTEFADISTALKVASSDVDSGSTFYTQGGGIHYQAGQLANMKAFEGNSLVFETAVGAVPEPATASLGLLGLAALMMRRRRA